MYQNGGKNGNSVFRKEESTIFTAARIVNRKCVFQGDVEGSRSIVLNVEIIL